MTTYHGTEVKLRIERLSVEGKIPKEFIGILSGGAVAQDFYTANFPITWDAGEAGGVTGAVAANAPTSSVFKTDLASAVEDYYKDMTLRFTSGSLDGEMSIITSYAQATKQITVSPAFSEAPSVTDAFIIEPSVDVFTDDGTPGSWTEYLEDGTDYIIDATTGKVTILAAENQAGNAGEHISISYYTAAYVGRGQNVSMEFEGELTEIFELGSRNPQELKEGKIKLGGTIGQLYCSRDIIGKVIGISDFYKRLADFSFYLYPGGAGAGKPYIKMSNVKFGKGSLKADINSMMALDVEYKGLAMATGTQ